MTIEEAIQFRHSVRRYLPTPLSSEQIEALQQKISELNEAYSLHIQLILNDEEAFNSRMAHYGNFRGVKNFIAIVGPKEKREMVMAASAAPGMKSLDERAGYASAQLVLFAQTLGLNTCIAAMTFRKTANIQIDSGESLVVAIAIGCGETQGSQHPMRPATRIAPAYENAPDWFRKGIDSVLLAPSALNQFRADFSISGEGTVVAKPRLGFSAKVDLGIFKYFFELGAGVENFRWN